MRSSVAFNDTLIPPFVSHPLPLGLCLVVAYHTCFVSPTPEAARFALELKLDTPVWLVRHIECRIEPAHQAIDTRQHRQAKKTTPAWLTK
eukprot:6551908-Prymnesium_polylepis.1